MEGCETCIWNSLYSRSCISLRVKSFFSASHFFMALMASGVNFLLLYGFLFFDGFSAFLASSLRYLSTVGLLTLNRLATLALNSPAFTASTILCRRSSEYVAMMKSPIDVYESEINSPSIPK